MLVLWQSLLLSIQSQWWMTTAVSFVYIKMPADEIGLFWPRINMLEFTAHSMNTTKECGAHRLLIGNRNNGGRSFAVCENRFVVLNRRDWWLLGWSSVKSCCPVTSVIGLYNNTGNSSSDGTIHVSCFLLLVVPRVVRGIFTNMVPLVMQAVVCDMSRGKGGTKNALQCICPALP